MWVQTEPENLTARRMYESAGGRREPGVDVLYSWRFSA
jgi:hypothetical protein